MVTCPNCGHKGIFKSVVDCKVCQKELCERCGIYLFKIWAPASTILDSWYVCSTSCLEAFAQKVEKQADSKDLQFMRENPHAAISLLVRRTLMISESHKLNEKTKLIRFQINFAPLEELDYNPGGNLLWKRLQDGHLRETLEAIEISNFIKAGRYEDAAKYYEKLGMFEEAGKLRARNREIIVKKTEVTVDLNSLLKQVADGGIVAIYRCPHCGGKLKIGKDITANTLRICEHCNSEIATVDLADFLRTVLS